MLISRKQRKRLWKKLLLGVIVPSALSYGLAYGQEPVAAPAVQEIPMRSADDSIPPPPSDDAVDTEPGRVRVTQPGIGGSGCTPHRAGCTSGSGCGPGGAACTPGAAGRQADTLVCSPRGNSVNCGPAAGCLAGSTCPDGSYCSMDGMPCMAADGSCLSSEVLMGRPYTIGDLKRSLFGAKCRTKEILGMDGCSGCSPLHCWWTEQQYKSNCRRAYRNHVLAAHFHNKFNYFKPSGCCGEGCPPFGCYKRVYATEPHYMDGRDSQVYASPMTGHPTAVPLAPTVRHQYNYSWGVPSSRLTPISNVVLPRRQ